MLPTNKEITLTSLELRNYNIMYKKHYVKLVNYIRFKVRNQQDAEDIVQLGFAKAARLFSSYNPNKAAISTWIYNICNTILIDHVRENKIRISANSMVGEDEVVENNFVASKTAYADSEIINNEITDKLVIAFEGLNPKYKRIATLFFINEYSHDEIVELLNISLNSVKVSIFRCREQMQKSLVGTYKELAMA